MPFEVVSITDVIIMGLASGTILFVIISIVVGAIAERVRERFWRN